MNFAIRDDDTNYFTKPQDLLKTYSEIWDKCPISLAVVPFHACTKSGPIPQEYWRGTAIFPIAKNTELVAFLREKITENRISIMLHGYSHKDHRDGYEFETGKDLSQKVKKGKEYLEQIFGVKVKTFVPPHNTLSKEGLNAVTRNGLNITNVPSFRFSKRAFKLGNIAPWLKIRYFGIRHKNYYPYVIDFDHHKEVVSHPLTPIVNLEQLKSDFDFSHKMNGDFLLATHYWELLKTENLRKTFERFWQYVGQKELIEFCNVDSLFEGGL